MPLALETPPPASPEVFDGDAPRVLVVDDEPNLLRYFEYNVRRMGYGVRVARTLAEMQSALEEESFAIVLLDLMLPDGESLDAVPALARAHPRTSIVLVTAHGTIPKAVQAIRHGAVNFVQKPVSPEQLEAVVAHAVELWRLKRENRELRRRLEPVAEFQGMIGQSDAMQRIYALIETVAGTAAPVLVTGESGVGKELVARAIHSAGPRSSRPFIAINCAAIPRDLLESEIFGHERGSFTGAVDQYRGCFERADKGTLFLDEIGEMDVNLQAKLLRLIQEQSFYRIGGSQQIRVNVRIVAATNRDPYRMVEEGRFREDLYYRLNVLPLHVPPLRDRREDIALLATRLLQRAAAVAGKDFHRFELDALAALESHPWPGNVRELQNVVEQVVVLHDGEKVTAAMLPEYLRRPRGRGVGEDRAASGTGASGPGGGADGARAGGPESLRPFWQIERDEIQRALDVCKGSVQEAARRLEISAATLYRKIEKYGLVK